MLVGAGASRAMPGMPGAIVHSCAQLHANTHGYSPELLQTCPVCGGEKTKASERCAKSLSAVQEPAGACIAHEVGVPASQHGARHQL